MTTDKDADATPKVTTGAMKEQYREQVADEEAGYPRPARDDRG